MKEIIDFFLNLHGTSLVDSSACGCEVLRGRQFCCESTVTASLTGVALRCDQHAIQLLNQSRMLDLMTPVGSIPQLLVWLYKAVLWHWPGSLFCPEFLINFVFAHSSDCFCCLCDTARFRSAQAEHIFVKKSVKVLCRIRRLNRGKKTSWMTAVILCVYFVLCSI